MKRSAQTSLLVALGLLLILAGPSAFAAPSLSISSPAGGASVTGDTVDVAVAIGGASDLKSYSILLNGQEVQDRFTLVGENLLAQLGSGDGLLTGAEEPGTNNTLAIEAVFQFQQEGRRRGRRSRGRIITIIEESQVSFFSQAGPPGATFDVIGKVGGTVLMAVVDNKIVASYSTTGKAFDLDTDGDHINDAYSFILTGIPQGVNVRLYFMENGQLYEFVYLDGGTPVNVFTLNGSDTLDLGFVQSIPEGVAGSQNSPGDDPNVTAQGLDLTMPAILNNPDTSGMTLQQLLAAGFAALRENWVVRANAYFGAAVDMAGTTPSNDRDVANLFYAGTRIVSLWYNIEPGTDPAVLQTFGDILDAFGYKYVNGLRTNFRNIKPLNLKNDVPADCPTGADLQEFLVNVARPEVVGAINNLNAVSSGVLKTWYVPLFKDRQVETDYADALLMRAALKACLAVIDIQDHYDLNADIYKMIHNTQTLEDLFAGTFLKPKGQGGNLNGEKSLFIEALDDCVAGLGLLRNRPNAPESYFVGLVGFSQKCAPFVQIAAFSVKTSLEGILEFELLDEIRFALDIPALFLGIDASLLVPPFVGNRIVGMFPDITLAGLFPNGFFVDFPNNLFGIIPEDVDVNINLDIDGNGLPDILLLNFCSVFLDEMDPSNPEQTLVDLVWAGHKILNTLLGNTLSETNVDDLCDAAPNFVPAPVATAVAEFLLTIGEQMSDPLTLP